MVGALDGKSIWRNNWSTKGLLWLVREVAACIGSTTERKYMLWTICVILIILWLLGLVSSYTMGGLIHILLVIAIIMILVNLISGRGRKR